jgi:trk system potassium uptake protein TrkH
MGRRLRLKAGQVIALGFLAIILLGSLLLSLPFTQRSGQAMPWPDALFTACSATCVTGLVVADTFSQFNLAGQIVILVLIQIGGLGFMAFALMVTMAFGRHLGLRGRSMLMESVSSLHIAGVETLVLHILAGTAITEGCGAVLLTCAFVPRMGFWRGLWNGIFHAVSAFCNAGFDLMGRFEPYSSLSLFRDDVFVNLVVMALIVIGGVGFLVWEDLRQHGLRFSRYRLHTKLMLTATAILILVPALVFFITEKDASMAGLGVGQRLLASLFQSVSARTAGFNTVPLERLSGGGALMMYVLMTVGAGAGSTAGGAKVTTFAVVILYITAFCSGKGTVSVFGRRLDEGQMRRAFCVLCFFVGVSLLACLLVMLVQALPLQDVLFEVFSAMGTVGLSTGITRSLLPASRLLIVVLMYMGRLGSINMVMAVTEKKAAKIREPVEQIVIG